jgi:hypothetical protein
MELKRIMCEGKRREKVKIQVDLLNVVRDVKSNLSLKKLNSKLFN